jgi:hypothetical protein
LLRVGLLRKFCGLASLLSSVILFAQNMSARSTRFA